MGIHPIGKVDLLAVHVFIYICINAKLLTLMSSSSVSNLGLSIMNCININNATGNNNITANINMALLETNLSCRKFANIHTIVETFCATFFLSNLLVFILYSLQVLSKKPILNKVYPIWSTQRFTYESMDVHVHVKYVQELFLHNTVL